jgi:hypothetical protein
MSIQDILCWIDFLIRAAWFFLLCPVAILAAMLINKYLDNRR